MTAEARSIRHWLEQATRRLDAHSDSPRLDAELLLAHCLQRDRSWLMAWPEHPLEPAMVDCFQALLRQRLEGQPVAYLLGEREFWSLSLAVTPATLVPRPETELLVETALDWLADRPAPRLLEMGTGSGAIALALKKERADADITATDISPRALAVAAGNARRHRLDIRFLVSDWYAAIDGGAVFDLILSNPPYIAAGDPFLQRGDLPAEPQQALCSGPEGLEALRRIIAGAPDRLKPGGGLILEHGYRQGDAVRGLLQAEGFERVHSLEDFSGLPRVSLGTKPGPVQGEVEIHRPPS